MPLPAPRLCNVSASASNVGICPTPRSSFASFSSKHQQASLGPALESHEATPGTQPFMGWRDPTGWVGTGPGTQALTSPSPQVFREQGIDGETLPLLTEEHLLTTMGLKLGPALKIRAQVSASWGQ